MQHVKKIVIIGPESTGKSTLCQLLAHHYHTLWCPEYAREYLLLHGTNYSYEDLLTIAKGQVALEDEYLNRLNHQSQPEPPNDKFLFVDTDMYVMKVWCEFVFGKCHQYIIDAIPQRRADLYLLCNTDLPWVKDELREYPNVEIRDKLLLIYRDLLKNQQVPWVIIEGGYKQRLSKAVTAVNDHFFAGAFAGDFK